MLLALFVLVCAVSARDPVPDPKPLPLPGTVELCDITKDCDKDIDCVSGLKCADAHKAELKAMGFDERGANCKNIATKPWNWEVCFDPAILKPSGGGGGDPHFRTYDGTKYSFHGQCDLIMARSTTFGSGLGLDVHARTEIVSGWSLISNAAIRIGKDVLEIVNDGSHYFNGEMNTKFPLVLAKRYSVSKNDEILGDDTSLIYTIDLGNGEVIKVSTYKTMISVRIDAALEGTEGMLGIHGKVGMIGRDRETEVDDANSMGAEWQVQDHEPMLFHVLRAPQYPTQCILPNVATRRLRMSQIEQTKANQACASVNEDMREFCIHDVMLTGDISLAHGYTFAF